MIYGDASFLVSLCLADIHSPAAVATMKRLRREIVVTPLQRHELRNAIRLAVWRTRSEARPVTAIEAVAALDQAEARFAAGEFLARPLPWARVIDEADRIGGSMTMRFGVRSLDLLNVAAAVTLGATRFLTFDLRQADLARACGLEVGVPGAK